MIAKKNLNMFPRTKPMMLTRKRAIRTTNGEIATRTVATTTHQGMAASEEGIRRIENDIYLKMMEERESPWVKETTKGPERTRDLRTSILMRWWRKTTC